MGLNDALTFGIEGVIGIFIFIIFFTALAPSVIDYINNAPAGAVGLPQATILIFSLLALVFVVGIFMMLWRKITEPSPPQYGGGY